MLDQAIMTIQVTEEMQALRERNASRIQAAKEQMGTQYLLHPANKIQRKPVSKPTL